MSKNCCCNLTNFWTQGDYEGKTTLPDGTAVSTSTVSIKYLYNCCNKVYAVEISGSSTSGSTTVTYTVLYYCDGRYKYTDSLGGLVCGKWVCKCGKLCTLVKGTEKLIGLSGSGKFVESKSGNLYNGDIYVNEMGVCTLKYKYNLTPKLL